MSSYHSDLHNWIVYCCHNNLIVCLHCIVILQLLINFFCHLHTNLIIHWSHQCNHMTKFCHLKFTHKMNNLINNFYCSVLCHWTGQQICNSCSFQIDFQNLLNSELIHLLCFFFIFLKNQITVEWIDVIRHFMISKVN